MKLFPQTINKIRVCERIKGAPFIKCRQLSTDDFS